MWDAKKQAIVQHWKKRARFMPISIYIQAQKEDNPNMNMPPHGRGRLTSVQETVQTLLLIIVTFVGTWLALYRVPWQVSADPCLLGAVAAVGVVTCLWLTRWGDCTEYF